MRNTVFLKEIPVDLLNNQDIYQLISDWLWTPDNSRQIVTLNAAMLMAAERNPRLKRVIQQADLVTIDGYGIELALKKKGQSNIERLCGVQLARQLLKIAIQTGSSVYFFGGSPRVAKLLQEMASCKWPGLTVSGVRDGFSYQERRSRVIAEIIEKQPNLLFAGLGSPEQELFLSEVLPYLKGTVGVGVGGAFEVITGVKREAPGFIRRRGYEWCYRMLQDPRKLKLLPDLIRFWRIFLRCR
ncbi:MAG: WecB/TagA/CpsF family glycosyltransferase [Bacillota bacterium]